MDTTGTGARQGENLKNSTGLKESTSSPLNSGKSLPSSEASSSPVFDKELAKTLDCHSLESIVELKISRFLEQIGTYYPEALHATIMRKTEKPLLNQILRRTGGNQVHAARILGINRNTLRKKMKFYGFC